MLKIIPPYSYDFGEPRVSLVQPEFGKAAWTLKAAFKKKAFGIFSETLNREPPQKGEVPIFLIALGAGEYFGPNRNGDYFSVQACKQYHSTFVKHARFFRNHQNTDKSRSYGIVKASYFNPEAGRIELLVYLNGDEEAAKRNGGLVADKELEKLASGEDIPVSMSCKVPFDVCSGCGHKSTSRAEYCDESNCTKYGGLKNNIGRTFDDGHTLCALNPICDWFDISHVFHPADRIAYVLGTLSLQKQANGSVISGAELAERLDVSDPLWHVEFISSDSVSYQYKLLEKYAQLDKKPELRKMGFSSNWPKLPELNSDYDRRLFVYGSIKYGCLMPASIFSRVLNYPNFEFAIVGSFNNLSKKANILSKLQQNPFVFKDAFRCFDLFYETYQPKISVLPDHLICRAAIVDKPVFKKQAEISKDIEDAVSQYCLYKLAFMDYWRNKVKSKEQLENIVYLMY